MLWRILLIQAVTRVPVWIVLLSFGSRFPQFISGLVQIILLLVYWWIRRPGPRSWLGMHLLLSLFCSIALLYPISPMGYGLMALVVFLVQGRTDRDRVPLYFSSYEVLTVLATLMPQNQGVFFDLGCGDGRVLAYLSKRYPGWGFKGFELALIPWLLAQWRCRDCANVEIFRSSFWQAPINQADVIYCFLSPEPMRELGDQFSQQGHKGSLLISNSFEIPDGHPDQVLTIKGVLQTNLYVYLFAHQ